MQLKNCEISHTSKLKFKIGAVDFIFAICDDPERGRNHKECGKQRVYRGWRVVKSVECLAAEQKGLSLIHVLV